MSTIWRLALICVALVSADQAWCLDARAHIERAVELVEAGDQALARAYLEPALIDPRLSPEERSRAYYVRGFSFQTTGLFASAAKDYHHALEFHPGNSVVLAAVAQLHLDGLGVDRNPALAVALLEQAAAADLPDGMLRLGHLYLIGRGVERDVDLAREWLAKAAARGSAQAMLQIGQSWRAPFADPPDPAQAVDWFERAHAAGATEALALIGFMLEGGELGEPDPARVREAFAAAAEAGSAVGQAKLAHLYLEEDGNAANAKEALRLFQASAAQAHPAGFMGLGYLYEAGIGLAADADEALRWYTRAAEAGMVDAQLRLAYAALRKKDPGAHRAAADWLARAAPQGNPQAMNDYAWLLATSPDATLRDGPRALYLASRAVELERNPGHLDTLAAAYAELGRFSRAVATQREALAAVATLEPPPANRAALERELKAHLDAFEAGRPWRE